MKSEEILFEMYKEEPVGNSQMFYYKMKKNHNLEMPVGLYRKIINYQVKKYGTSLTGFKIRRKKDE